MADGLGFGLARWYLARARPAQLLFAALAGGVTGTGHVPFSFEFGAVAGLSLGLLLFLADSSPRRAFATGWAFGTGYFAISLFWIVEPFLVDVARHGWMAPFALLALSGGLALFWALAFSMARGLSPQGGGLIGLGLCLAAAEFARGYVFTGFPWGLIAYLWADTSVLQWVAFVGPYGLTLLTLMAIALFWHWLLAPARHLTLIAPFPLVALILAGLAFEPDPQDTTGRAVVRLIQPNAPQHQKWDPDWMQVFYDRQLGFTAAEAAGQAPALVVWPETSIPWRLSNAEVALGVISETAGVPVVVGARRRDAGLAHNALVAIGAGGEITALYDKHRLVPFGEYIPFGQITQVFGLQSFASQDGYGYTPGPGAILVDTPLGRALPLICYEAIFPQHVGSVKTRPDYILQITNDAWFGEISGPYQHLAQARSRAIEQGLPLVRVANTGVSAVIDAGGHILAQIPLGEAGFLDAALPAPKPLTPYARSGDWPVLLVLIAGVAATALRRTRQT